jgi:ribonuclease BN (tRNA processing enzyme)
MLKFLGVGAAFNIKENNTSAYFIKDKTLYLFDCGEKICDKIIKNNLLEKVDNIYCFITHLHSDHIGSLEALMYYVNDISDQKIYVFYPQKNKLKTLLKLMGVSFDFEIIDDFSKVKSIKIEPVVQKHIPGSYGYFVYTSGFNFFYSGDTCKVNKRAVQELKCGKIDVIYHEFTISLKAKIHTHLSLLTKAIPVDLRNKVYLMHYINKQTKNEGKKAGFCICEEEK